MTGPNRTILELVASDLGELVSEVVFVGGQITELLITDEAAVRIRPTTDVDVIVTAATRAEFHGIENKLRELDFRNDRREDAPICRWISPGGGVLDLMPTDARILGFSNRWYEYAVLYTESRELSGGIVIRHPTAPTFVATKIAAYLSRGRRDLFGSHDLEDVITLVAGRPELGEEMGQAPSELRRWVASQIAGLLEDPDFPFAIQGALPDAASIPGYLGEVMARFNDLTASDEDPDRRNSPSKAQLSR